MKPTVRPMAITSRRKELLQAGELNDPFILNSDSDSSPEAGSMITCPFIYSAFRND